MILPTTFEQAPTEINVFTIHEIGLIQQTDRIQCFPSHPHEGTAQDFNLMIVICMQMAHVILVQLCRSRGQFVQA